MANRLLRFEAALFRRSFAAAFAKRRDIALLLVMLALAGLWLRDALAASGSLPPDGVWLAALTGPAAFSWQRLVCGRLRWFAEHSVLTPDALNGRTRRAYLGAAHLLLAAALLVTLALLALETGRAAETLLVGLASAALGMGLGSLWPRQAASAGSTGPGPPVSAGGKRAALLAVLRRQTGSFRRPMGTVIALLVANFACTALASWLAHGEAEAVRTASALAPSLAVLLLASRIDAGLIGFLPFAGYRPLFVAAIVSALPAASFLAAAAALVVAGGSAIAFLVLGLLHLSFVLFGVLRAWLYPGREARSVDLQVQIEIAGLLLVGLLLPPVALAALFWRLWWLYRHGRALAWTLP